MIACLAVIARDNSPFYFKVVRAEDEGSVALHYIVHTSIDVFEEKFETSRGSQQQAADLFLGLLFPMEDYRLYGYVTPTNMKMVLVLDDSDAKPDDMIKAFMRRVHALLVDAMSNPFHASGAKLSSKKFESELSEMIRLWNSPNNPSYVAPATGGRLHAS